MYLGGNHYSKNVKQTLNRAPEFGNLPFRLLLLHRFSNRHNMTHLAPTMMHFMMMHRFCGTATRSEKGMVFQSK
jgi:hypothetical protein